MQGQTLKNGGIALILALSPIFSFGQLTTESYRPDFQWFTGMGVVTNPLDSVLSQWSWSNGGLSIEELDLDKRYGFSAANASYVDEAFILQSNGCYLARNFVDSISSTVQYDDFIFFRPDDCNQYPDLGTAAGYDFIIPLSSVRLFYSTQIYTDVPDPYWLYAQKSFAFTYLDRGMLADSVSIDPAEIVVEQFEFAFQDTVIDACVNYIPNPAGGWWGIAKSAVSNRFQRYWVNEDSVSLLPAVAVGPAGFRRERSAARLTFNPAGDLFAVSGTDDGVALYTFDRATADIALYDTIAPSFDTTYEAYKGISACAFSACGRYLYVTTFRHVNQFDMYAPDIAASAIQINDIDRLPFVTGYSEIQRGPDCRMYISWPSFSTVVSVIDKPSQPGRSCELYEQGITGLTEYFEYLPHFPEYHLWAKDQLNLGHTTRMDTAVCDSNLRPYPYMTYSSISEEATAAQLSERLLWPNPAMEGSTVIIGLLPKEVVQVSSVAQIFSLSGQLLEEVALKIAAEGMSFQVPELASGLYRIVLLSNKDSGVLYSASLVVR
ncbi:MAG: hypothetical protein AB8F78_16640 [Saprospiraceae bacterium]